MLRADVKTSRITEITGANRKVIAAVKKKLEAGVSLKRPSGPPGNKKLTEEFMTGLKNSIEAEPTTSIRKWAKIKKVSAPTISTAVKRLGKASRVRPKRQLLTAKQKVKRVDRCNKIVNDLKA